MDLVFVTNNAHKINEINNIINNKKIKILSLKDIGFSGDIAEDCDTLEGNASQKANFIYNKYHCNCFADDTGLEIEALNGRPGVYSARYAGEACDFDDNMNKVLEELKNIENRKARFRTVISLIIDGKEKLFEGIVNGKMLREKSGIKGFGYDPIFQPDGHNISFAQMDLNEKNKISHRGIATQKLIDYLINSYL
ncbi:MAG: non-canonical purine NTP diphosphatase [Bacteroidales bacterium]|nr:non-canonical purine NTP diphosphatase [Bacteroidales bacterium]